MVAGPLIAQRAVDHDEVGRLPRRENLTRRGEANHELAPAGKQLLSNKDGEGRTNDPANNSDTVAAEVERIEFGVIARPTCERLCRPGAPQRAHQVAIRVQNADRGTSEVASPFCRRASRSRAAGANTDGMDVCLLSRMGGMTMF